MKHKIYSIDGKYGRVEFNIFGKQKGEDTTYNYVTCDDNGHEIEGEDFIKGLPDKITNDDYFKMALLSVLRSLKNATYRNGNSLDEIKTELENLGLK